MEALMIKTPAHHDIFLSYASKDVEFATQLLKDLKAAGLNTWSANEKLFTGDNLRESIDVAVRDCDLMLCVLSKAYMASNWCRYEFNSELAREVKEGRVRVLPITIDGTLAEGLNVQKVWGDFTDKEQYRRRFRGLLKAISSHIESDYRYSDEPKDFLVWTPGRGGLWRACRKLFWYQYVAHHYWYVKEGRRDSELARLRRSFSLSAFLGRLTHAEMLANLAGVCRFADTESVSRWLYDKVRTKLATAPDQFIEVNNGHKEFETSITRRVDDAVRRYETWKRLFADRFAGWNPIRQVPSYYYKTTDFAARAYGRPFAETEGGTKVLFLENKEAEVSRHRARDQFLYYVIGCYYGARAGQDRRSAQHHNIGSLFEEGEFTDDPVASVQSAPNFHADVIYLDDRKTEQLRYADKQQMYRARQIVHSKAGIYSHSRRSRIIGADPSERKCLWCRFLSICNEGKDHLDTSWPLKSMCDLSTVPPETTRLSVEAQTEPDDVFDLAMFEPESCCDGDEELDD